MHLRAKHIAVTLSLSLLLIPSIYSMESIEIDLDYYYTENLETPESSENSNNIEKDFDYFWEKHEETLKNFFFQPKKGFFDQTEDDDPYKIGDAFTNTKYWRSIDDELQEMFTHKTLEDLKKTKEFEIAKEIFNDSSYLLAFNKAVTATTQINDNSNDELISQVGQHWHWGDFLNQELNNREGCYNSLTEKSPVFKNMPTLSVLILLGLTQIETYPWKQAFLKMKAPRLTAVSQGTNKQ